MKKEIGSIFTLSDSVLKQAESEQIEFSGDKLYYSLCREALYDIAKAMKGSSEKVLIPAYTCQTVITPFLEAGWQCEYYSISKQLRINSQSILDAVDSFHPSLVVVHPFFGMDFNSEEMKVLNIIKEKGIRIVLDLTQCLFSTQNYSFASFVVASYRKWMPIPDGGEPKCLSDSLVIKQPEEENTRFVQREIAAMFLRGQYFSCGEQRMKEISIRLSKEADNLAERNIKPHKMSHVAYSLLMAEDRGRNQRIRFENYRYLFQNVQDNSKITKVCKDMLDVTTSPLYFTIYVKERSVLQQMLAQNAIYAPVIWPVEDERVLIDEGVKYIYDHLLAIPCDQRYDENDMRRAVEIINNY